MIRAKAACFTALLSFCLHPIFQTTRGRRPRPRGRPLPNRPIRLDQDGSHTTAHPPPASPPGGDDEGHGGRVRSTITRPVRITQRTRRGGGRRWAALLSQLVVRTAEGGTRGAALLTLGWASRAHSTHASGGSPQCPPRAPQPSPPPPRPPPPSPPPPGRKILFGCIPKLWGGVAPR